MSTEFKFLQEEYASLQIRFFEAKAQLEALEESIKDCQDVSNYWFKEYMDLKNKIKQDPEQTRASIIENELKLENKFVS